VKIAPLYFTHTLESRCGLDVAIASGNMGNNGHRAASGSEEGVARMAPEFSVSGHAWKKCTGGRMIRSI
jgi:hypothetical protein